jgi:hypothetical protein
VSNRDDTFTVTILSSLLRAENTAFAGALSLREKQIRMRSSLRYDALVRLWSVTGALAREERPHSLKQVRHVAVPTQGARRE